MQDVMYVIRTKRTGWNKSDNQQTAVLKTRSISFERLKKYIHTFKTDMYTPVILINKKLNKHGPLDNNKMDGQD